MKRGAGLIAFYSGIVLMIWINALAFDRKARKVRAREKPLRGTAKLPWLDPWQGKLKPPKNPSPKSNSSTT